MTILVGQEHQNDVDRIVDAVLSGAPAETYADAAGRLGNAFKGQSDFDPFDLDMYVQYGRVPPPEDFEGYWSSLSPKISASRIEELDGGARPTLQEIRLVLPEWFVSETGNDYNSGYNLYHLAHSDGRQCVVMTDVANDGSEAVWGVFRTAEEALDEVREFAWICTEAFEMRSELWLSGYAEQYGLTD